MADLTTGSITGLSTTVPLTQTRTWVDPFIPTPILTPPHQHNFVPYPPLPKDTPSARRIYCVSCGEVRKLD